MWRISLIMLVIFSCSVSGGVVSAQQDNQAIILLLDKSGSMRDENRLNYAREAATAVTHQLNEADFFGVLAFDVGPFVVVLVERVARLRELDLVQKQLERVKPGGKTSFFPALVEAERQLERLSTARKHIIFLSDGATGGKQDELLGRVRSMIARVSWYSPSPWGTTLMSQ
jgi:uncharacterized protein with von Willebrand factor type A (vWA) domain